MSPFLLLLLLSSLSPTLSSLPHSIPIPSSIPQPSSLTWDPTAQHFLLSSSSLPTIFSISDASIPNTIISHHPLISSISLDNPRRRLLVASRNPHTLTAYDLRSPRPHTPIFSSPLPSSPAATAADPKTGLVYVTASDSGAIWRIDLEGIVFQLPQLGAEGLVGLAYARTGFLLAVEGRTGRVFKVDEESGAAREVAGAKGGAAKGIAVMVDGRAVVGGGTGARMVRSGDGWAEAAVVGEVRVGEGREVEGVAVREGKSVYVLVAAKGEGGGDRIEEVEWEEEGDLVWLMVAVGFGLAYFLYWRFQMRELVASMNKKRE